MYLAGMAAIVVTMFLALARAAIGPTVFDRILAVNMFGTKTVLLIATGTLAVLRFARFGNLARDDRKPDR